MEKKSVQSEEAFRQSLASELNDMDYIQDLLLECDEVFAKRLPDEFGSQFADIFDEDIKSSELIETAITNYGLRIEGNQGPARIAESLLEVAMDESYVPLTRLRAYGLLRALQENYGQLVENVLPAAEADVKEALVPLMKVISDNRERTKMFNKMLDDFGVEYLTGEQPNTGFTERLRGFGVAISEMMASKKVEPAEETSVLTILRMDHNKVKTLLKEVRKSDDLEKRTVLYQQLAADVRAHSEAEEEIVYAFFQEYDDIKQRLDKSQLEHEQIRALLSKMDNVPPISDDFITHLDALENLLKDHIREEEYSMFGIFREKANKEELIELSFEFSERKKEIQKTLSSEGGPFRTTA